MNKEICIEWLLEESELEHSDLPESKIVQLTAMTLDEEIKEILIPLNHPIGAASIQIIGLGTTYECVMYYSQHNNRHIDEINLGHVFFCLLAVFAIVAFLCWKYWLPRHLSWVCVSLLAISTWIIAEWSLFLD